MSHLKNQDEKKLVETRQVDIDTIRAEPIFADPSSTDSEGQSLDEKKFDNGGDRSSGTRHQTSLPAIEHIKQVLVRTSGLFTSNPIVQKLLGGRNLAHKKNERDIILDASRGTPLIDERTGRHYINNSIRTSRYTLLTFIPHQLWFQFSKIANLYFLITGIIQLIPGLSTTGTYTTILPLVFFLLFTVAREGYDDFRRYLLDREENGRMARVLYGFRPHVAKGYMNVSVSAMATVILKKLKQVTQREGRRAILQSLSLKAGQKAAQAPASGGRQSSEHSPWTDVKWIQLRVGDIIKLKRDEQVPADVVLLHVDGRDGVAYVETMALDGETNLKNRHSIPQLQCQTLDEVSKCRARFVVEDPNPNLYDFYGKVSLDETTIPLTLSNVILRGCIVRNTSHVVGMVINTGEECKIRMNANKNPEAKAPAIQKMTNKVVILLALFVVLLAIGCTIGYVIWKHTFEDKAWYLQKATLPLIDIFIAFAIMFNNLIPLALYVSLELIKFAQFLLLKDIEMYHEASNTPMVSNTQNIYENLGQVSYILSDKTGTLTENVMQLRKITVGGEIWSHYKTDEKELKQDGRKSNVVEASKEVSMQQNTTVDESRGTRSDTVGAPEIIIEVPAAPERLSISQHARMEHNQRTDNIFEYLKTHHSGALTEKLRFFILSLAICHTCFPETQESGKAGFQAASPDELALVEAAQDLGYLLIDRTTQTITLLIAGTRQTYTILNIIEFSSKRKRMSIIVKLPDGKICLFCKGADSVLLPRFRSDFRARETASLVQDRRLQRLSMEIEDALVRKSVETESRKSFQRSRHSLNIARPGPPTRNNSSGVYGRRSMSILESDAFRQSGDPSQLVGSRSPSIPRRSMGNFSNRLSIPLSRGVSFQSDRRHDLNDAAGVLERCLEHIDTFASDGLRTLVYGYRYLEQEEYSTWSKVYHDATTSLTNRQELIESAAEDIERDLDLAGATGIEDKLQEGVPETIEKLQQANIKIWMLTGDKRETAINIAHSAKICKSYSEITILNEAEIEHQLSEMLIKLDSGVVAHSVIVIDGQTLMEVSRDETLNSTFYSLLLRVDSVICTRASPSQKAAMVQHIRRLDGRAITLAIGDGGNDIAMIQAAHVGVGISGREGLQAARVADYSVAQFRFLQRLLLVHGHWLYVRTAKFILLTFWKEMLFYVVQLLYQRWNGYTGTSLFESWSLAVWNTLFTALPVMIPGIFEQDLSAETLLNVPELYGYGQQGRGFNMRKYWWWMFMAVSEALVIYFMIYGLYGLNNPMGDEGLFAVGDLGFSVCVVFINVKLLILDYHYKTWIPLFSALLTISGWWAWNLFLSAAYTNSAGVYTAKSAFTHHFDINWWVVLIIVIMVCVEAELCIDAVRRRWWPDKVELWQEREKVRRRAVTDGDAEDVT